MMFAAKNKRRTRRSWKDYLRLTIRQRGSTPEQIGMGVAIGTFIAFTPTVGIHLPLALVIATLVRANRLACIPPVFITNVFTIPPIYAFTYWLGDFFLPGPREDQRQLVKELTHLLAKHDFYSIHEQLHEFLKLGGDIFIAMFIGGFIVGGLCAAILYYLTVRVVRRHRSHRRERLQLRSRYLEKMGFFRRKMKPEAPPPPGSDS